MALSVSYFGPNRISSSTVLLPAPAWCVAILPGGGKPGAASVCGGLTVSRNCAADFGLWPIATLPQEFMSAMPGKRTIPSRRERPKADFETLQDSDQFARSFASDCVIGSTAITTPQSLRQAREPDHGQTFQSNPTQQPVAWSS